MQCAVMLGTDLPKYINFSLTILKLIKVLTIGRYWYVSQIPYQIEELT